MPVRIETKNPHTLILVLSLLIVSLALAGHFTRIPFITQYQFWVAIIGYLVLLWAVLFVVTRRFFLSPPRTGGEEGSCRVGKTRRPEPPVPRPQGSATSRSPAGVVESRGLRS